MSPTRPRRERLSTASLYSVIKQESFDHADLTTLVLQQLWLDRCTFVGADLRHATLESCHFKFCNFSSADLRGASLRSATFVGCDLRKADVRDCDLTDTHFGYVNTGSDNAFTNVTDVEWTVGALESATFERVVGRPTEVAGRPRGVNLGLHPPAAHVSRSQQVRRTARNRRSALLSPAREQRTRSDNIAAVGRSGPTRSPAQHSGST